MADCRKIPSPELPDEVMQIILSFLTNKNAIRQEAYPRIGTGHSAPSRIWFSIGDQSMKRMYQLDHNIVLHTFKLVSGWSKLDWPDDNVVTECIILATRKGVKNLFLSNWKKNLFDFPEPVLEANSLVELFLENCRLKYHERVMRPNLKRLSLDRVELDQMMLDNILSSCPLIEYLEIYFCSILNLHKPSVNKTTFPESFMRFGSCFYLPESQSQCLRRLSITVIKLDAELFMEFLHIFPHLEDLSIMSCNRLKRLKVSSSSLRILKLSYNIELEEAQLAVPSLVLFEYNGDVGPRLSFTNAPPRWTSRLSISHHEKVGALWFLKLKELLKGLCRSELHLKILFDIIDNATFHFDEVTIGATLFEVEENTEFCATSSLSSQVQPADCRGLAQTIIDGIFWTSRPHVISTKWDRHWVGYTESMYKLLVLGDKPYYFRSAQGKVWKSSLKGIGIFHYKLGRLGMKLDKMQN
ncbi:OLC1v1001783C1 [Oldenlandia corymbosa var. corymbosa]|uniref:OLC1v1001783C1 n=1 Tax=Oldenlandia corymbosa var. corymbosa TaxID=529605 RepID=A0AAV1D8E0_OLDCO|nr:OLC1v1001783C1 [Oldenlandia corymbosa var. corymbosa]